MLSVTKWLGDLGGLLGVLSFIYSFSFLFFLRIFGQSMWSPKLPTLTQPYSRMSLDRVTWWVTLGDFASSPLMFSERYLKFGVKMGNLGNLKNHLTQCHPKSPHPETNIKNVHFVLHNHIP